MLEFDETIAIIGVNPYVPVTREQAAALKPDWRRPMPVLVRINGLPAEPWKINMMSRGDGSFYLYLHETVRRASDTRVGDAVHVQVGFDDGYINGPQHPMPEELAAALDRDPVAAKNWDALPPSRQKEVLRMFAGLKSDEARLRNLQKALFVLDGNDGHFMGRDWTAGR